MASPIHVITSLNLELSSMCFSHGIVFDFNLECNYYLSDISNNKYWGYLFNGFEKSKIITVMYLHNCEYLSNILSAM